MSTGEYFFVLYTAFCIYTTGKFLLDIDKSIEQLELEKEHVLKFISIENFNHLRIFFSVGMLLWFITLSKSNLTFIFIIIAKLLGIFVEEYVVFKDKIKEHKKLFITAEVLSTLTLILILLEVTSGSSLELLSK